MPTPTRYAVVSLPLRIFDSGDREGALSSLRTTVNPENGAFQSFPIPEFKIGTLDALVQQADDLAKLDAGCEGVASRVADSLRTILDNDEEKLAQHKIVNDSKETLQPLIRSLFGCAAIKVPLLTSRCHRAHGPLFKELLLEQGAVPDRPSAWRNHRYVAKGKSLQEGRGLVWAERRRSPDFLDS